jgi:hypothetical protein
MNSPLLDSLTGWGIGYTYARLKTSEDEIGEAEFGTYIANH